MPPQWVWHAKSLQWRIWSEAEGLWVLRDGTRVPPSIPSSVGEGDDAVDEGDDTDETAEEGPSVPLELPPGLRQRKDSSLDVDVNLFSRMSLADSGLPDPNPPFEGVSPYEPPVDVVRSDPEEDQTWQNFSDPVLIAQGARSLTKVSAGSQERLDPRFKTRPSDFFSRGRVFKILWPEPRGDVNSGITIVSGTLNEEIAVKIRWFVVIRPNRTYCSCLPIQTYGGRGVATPQVTKSDHGIIFTGSKEPKATKAELGERFPGERPMRSPGVRVDPRSRNHKLDDMSRINYNKIYTIEHNVKVYDFGEVHRDHMRAFMKHFCACWDIDDAAAQRGKLVAAQIAELEKAQVEAVMAAAAEEASDDEEEGENDDPGQGDYHWEMNSLNQLVNHLIATWRVSTEPQDRERAEYLAGASLEEQQEYLRMMGVLGTAQQAQAATAGSSRRHGKRRKKRH